MRVIAIIPARGGSKAIPRKNLAEIDGKSLLQWTAEAAFASRVDRVILSTDDLEIASVGTSLGLEVPFLRPRHLAADNARSIDVVLHVLEATGEQPDAVMLLQPTSPFRTCVDVDNALALLERPRTDSVISVVPVTDHHPARMKLVSDGYLQTPSFGESVEGMRRQELPQLYLRNGAVYLTETSVLLSTGLFQGRHCRPLIMPSVRSINIDDDFDLVVARALVEHRKEAR